MAEQVGPDRDHRQEVAVEKAGTRRADVPRLEPAEVGVVAAGDVVEEGHGAAFLLHGRRGLPQWFAAPRCIRPACRCGRRPRLRPGRSCGWSRAGTTRMGAPTRATCST